MFLEPIERTPDYHCDHCKADMYSYDLLFEIDSDYLCPECYFQKILNKHAFNRKILFSEEDAISVADVLGDLYFEAKELKEAI